jgi:RNA recognition motif-containing protein
MEHVVVEMEEATPVVLSGRIDPTLVSTKRVVYLGGIPAAATLPMLRAALIPFGDLASLDLPMDYVRGTHRGFGFAEFTSADDAEEAIFNLDGAELLGQTLSVSVAQPNQVSRLTSSAEATEAVWNQEEWFQKQVGASTTTEPDAGEEDRKVLQEL